MYIHHTLNVIDVAAGALPDSWGQTSNLSHADAASLKAKGWLPVVYANDPAIPYNPLTHTRSAVAGVGIGDPVTPGADSVTGTYTLTALSLDAVVAWKKDQLSNILSAKKSPFAWDDGGGTANYRLDGDIKDWMFLVAANYFSNGGAVGWRLDGSQVIWPLPGLFPRTNADLQVVVVNKTNGAVSTLTYAASNPGATEYTITTTLGTGVVITLGAGGTAGNFLVAAVVPPADWPWLTAAVVKKTWTQAQYRAFLWAAFAQLWGCAGRYYALHTAITSVTGTDEEKIAKLTNPDDPGYIDLTTGWPETSVN